MKDLRNELIATLKGENKALKELNNIYLKELEKGVRPIPTVIDNKVVGEIKSFLFKNGETYDIQFADNNGVLVFVDAIFEAPFDDKEDWTKCTNNWDKCTLKPLLEKWWNDNAPDELKNHYKIDLSESEHIFPSNKQLEIFKNWKNRIKGLKGNDYATWWWTKTPIPTYANLVRSINPSGALDLNNANDRHGVVPACVPITESK